MFCWLCMGGPEEHPGSSPDHIAQCNNEDDVRKKGREKEMQNALFTGDNDVDTEYQEWLQYHRDKYEDHKD